MAKQRIVVSQLVEPPLRVAAVRDDEGVSFVVKIAYSFGEIDMSSSAPVATLASEQPAFSQARASTLAGAGEADAGYIADLSDGSPTVFLHGHAYASSPLDRIEIGVRVGGEDRHATAGGPLAEAIALVAQHIIGDASILQITPVTLTHDAHIELTGLSRRAEHVAFQLPDRQPWLAVDAGERRELSARCVRMHIDSDAEQVVTIWRARYEFIRNGNEIQRALVALDPPQTDDADRMRRLPRGHHGFAFEVEDFAAPHQPTEVEQARLQAARLDSLEHAADPELPIERYAQISAELAEQAEPRGETLKRHGFDETGFMVEERAWVERMGKSLMDGDGRLAAQFGELFIAAQDALGQDDAELSLEQWVALKVGFESSSHPPDFLAEQPLRLSQYLRTERRWRRRADEDASVAERLATELSAQRRRQATTEQGA